MSGRNAATFGGVYMLGVAAGAVLAAALATQGPPDAPAPDCVKETRRVEFGGNPANAAPIVGCLGADGALTWWPEDQRFSIRPSDDATHRADRWIPVKVNDRFVNLWGWADRLGAKGWRVSDQRTKVAAKRTPDPVPTPAPDEPESGALFGVVASELRAGQVLASDPSERSKVEAIMESGAVDGPNCPQPSQPARVPTPPLPSALRFDWILIAAVAAATLAVAAVAALAVVAALVARWRRG